MTHPIVEAVIRQLDETDDLNDLGRRIVAEVLRLASPPSPGMAQAMADAFLADKGLLGAWDAGIDALLRDVTAA